MTQTFGWALFGVVVVTLLVVDLGVLHRKAHAPSLREAGAWTTVYLMTSALFALWIFKEHPAGAHAGLAYVTGYLVEWSLSVDNVFVFAVVFGYFAVPLKYQHRVLFWGILSAVLMRAAFIFTGIKLIELFHPIIYIFGAFLLYTAYRLARSNEECIDPGHNPVVIWAREHLPFTSRFHGQRLLVREGDQWVGTPLLLVLLVIEVTDLMFALDSIPAVVAVTLHLEPDVQRFIVYTSNIFAILGLRALYFLLAGVMGLFAYLRIGLSVVLGFVGLKMLLSEVAHIPIVLSLGFIAMVIASSIAASLVWPPARDGETLPATGVSDDSAADTAAVLPVASEVAEGGSLGNL